MPPRFQTSPPIGIAAAAAIIFNLFFVVYSSSSSSDLSQFRGEGGLRGLKSFKEKPNDASNITFDCSPSGPCLPCLYKEKKEDVYRCSETGYRIPMKCVKTSSLPQPDQHQHTKNHNTRPTLENTNLLEQESTSNIDVGSGVYVTYRSCITAVNQEKLSLLGFEALMLMLLVCSSFVIFRRKGTLFMMPGAVRVPTNPRF